MRLSVLLPLLLQLLPIAGCNSSTKAAPVVDAPPETSADAAPPPAAAKRLRPLSEWIARPAVPPGLFVLR